MTGSPAIREVRRWMRLCEGLTGGSRERHTAHAFGAFENDGPRADGAARSVVMRFVVGVAGGREFDVLGRRERDQPTERIALAEWKERVGVSAFKAVVGNLVAGQELRVVVV